MTPQWMKNDAYRVISRFSDAVLDRYPALKGLKQELAYATGSVSDDFGRHTAQVYNMSDDVAEGLGKTAQQASQVSDEFASSSVLGKSFKSDDITSEQVTLSNGEIAYKSSDLLDGETILVRSPDYLDADGHIKWPDADGFVTDSSGNPITVPADLKTGHVIDRYGPSSGRFTSPVNNGEIVAFDKRGLPYPESFQEYYQYEVIQDLTEENILKSFYELPVEVQDNMTKDLEFYGKTIEDLANIQQGEIARVFDSGGGVQIQFTTSVKVYEDLGLIREVVK